MPGDETVSEEAEVAATDQLAPIEAPLDSVENDATDVEAEERVQRDQLSIALVAGLAALLLICVIFIFIANRHRPAGL